MEKANSLIKLKGLDKRQDYAGIKFDVIIDDVITMKNVDIIVHKVVDCIDIFCFKRDQTKDILEKLEKYKSKEEEDKDGVSSAFFRWLSGFEYKIPNIFIDNRLYRVRIIMIVEREWKMEIVWI